MERRVTIRRVVNPILNPKGFKLPENKPLASRPKELKAISLLDNCKAMAKPLLEAVKEYLESKGVESRYYNSYSCCHAGAFTKDLLDQVAKADAAVLASAD